VQNNTTSDGLERDYITAWSYGIGETWTLLVPNTKGGASVPLSENGRAMSKARPEYREIYQQIGQYWGEQPGTSGPVYVGAFVLSLFILGLFIVKGPMKWALLAGTIFSILLSWGKNFMGLTDFFIDHVPMYNKFRAVSSILVVAEFCIPLLASLAVKELVARPDSLKTNKKPLYISLGVTGGVALLFALAPKLFFSSFVSMSEMQAFQQALPAEHLQPFLANLAEMRVSVFTADAWRSFLVVLIGGGLIGLFLAKKIKPEWLIAGVLVLCLVDMWGVNKRYLNDDDFVPDSNQRQLFAKSPTDELILQDTAKYYRVLNMAASTFNDGVTPYYHKVIGGYHAAKLRRYQDLIDVHLSHEMPLLQQAIIETGGELDSVDARGFEVLNMLNAKWVIMPSQGGGTLPVENPHAMGNAWFVDGIRFVEGADEEIQALGVIDLRREAVADNRFAPVLEGFQPSPADSLSSIVLADYDSDFISYAVDAKKEELAVFSEIYYPKGWQVTIDGEPVEMLRVNYALRALVIPEGVHTVEFRFDPPSIKATDAIAYAALIIMLLTALFLVYRSLKPSRQDSWV
ncbi:MAG: YfhO family protein, partial [Proteiniphilum sp.]